MEKVLDDVNLEIEPGITAIIGPNAAGKSTLLRCLCGLLPSHGHILLDGRPANSHRRHELNDLISYLPQDLSTSASLTVFEMILLGILSQLSWCVSPSDVECVE